MCVFLKSSFLTNLSASLIFPIVKKELKKFFQVFSDRKFVNFSDILKQFLTLYLYFKFFFQIH